MQAIRLLALIIGICLLSVSNIVVPTAMATAQAADQSIWRRALDQVEITWDPQLAHPSFLRGPMPLPADLQSAQIDQARAALAFLADYTTLLGINKVEQELVVTNLQTDGLGFSHITLQQVYAGVAVYNAQIKIHMNEAENEVIALSNGFIPGIVLATVQPQQSAATIVAIAHQLVPRAILQQEPTLVIYPGAGSGRAAAPARLAWLVELADHTEPAHNIYLFDAITGELIDVLGRLHSVASTPLATDSNSATHIPISVPGDEPTAPAALRLATYNAHNTTDTPGALVRMDNAPPVGDADTDQAHDFANRVYEYYKNIHNRNSFDDQGGVITSTVHYGENMPNAFWSGQQMIYGDGFVALDIVGHELTHAVISHTANLEYRWQAGALHESIADIFGAMVDGEDWLLGEDLADRLGQAALRDMANPARFGQPSHTANWVKTCSDQEGMHLNSGILNKAYFMITTAIGQERAEQIFYRALVTYLSPTASFADARAAVLQATSDLYATAEHDAVVASFDAVGMTSTWQPPINDCECSIDTSLDPQAAALASATLYQVRDRRLATTDIGRYYTDLYYEHTAGISLLLLAQPELRAQAAHLLQTFALGFQGFVAARDTSEVLTGEMVNLLQTFLNDLARAADAVGNHDLAQILAREQARIDWHKLPGLDFAAAWDYLNSLGGPYTIYLPNIQQ